MKQAVEYIAGITMLILLFAAALLSSAHDHAVTVLFFLLTMLFTLRSISDTVSLPETLLQFAAACAMAVLSGQPYCFLLLSQIRSGKYDAFRIVTPALGLCVSALLQGGALYSTLLHAVIMTGIAAVLFGAERCIVKYFDTKEKLRRSVSICALGELNEKKLNEELRIKNYLSDRNARLEERENISRSIHNSVGHSITAAIMTLDAADMLFDTSPDKARQKVNTANERIRDSLASIRRAVRVLDCEDKPVPLSDLCESLAAICKSFTMDTRLHVSISVPEDAAEQRIPSVHAEFFCSAAGELLSNGVRHGHADRFIVALTSDSRHLQLTVTDNGESDFGDHNSDARIQNGFGLRKIISYCEKNGGKAEFSNAAGFVSTVVLPLIEEER